MAPAAKREQMSVADSGGGKGLRQDIKVELRIRPWARDQTYVDDQIDLTSSSNDMNSVSVRLEWPIVKIVSSGERQATSSIATVQYWKFVRSLYSAQAPVQSAGQPH